MKLWILQTTVTLEVQNIQVHDYTAQFQIKSFLHILETSKDASQAPPVSLGADV